MSVAETIRRFQKHNYKFFFFNSCAFFMRLIKFLYSFLKCKYLTRSKLENQTFHRSSEHSELLF